MAFLPDDLELHEAALVVLRAVGSGELWRSAQAVCFFKMKEGSLLELSFCTWNLWLFTVLTACNVQHKSNISCSASITSAFSQFSSSLGRCCSNCSPVVRVFLTFWWQTFNFYSVKLKHQQAFVEIMPVDLLLQSPAEKRCGLHHGITIWTLHDLKQNTGHSRLQGFQGLELGSQNHGENSTLSFNKKCLMIGRTHKF